MSKRLLVVQVRQGHDIGDAAGSNAGGVLTFMIDTLSDGGPTPLAKFHRLSAPAVHLLEMEFQGTPGVKVFVDEMSLGYEIDPDEVPDHRGRRRDTVIRDTRAMIVGNALRVVWNSLDDETVTDTRVMIARLDKNPTG